MLGKRAALQPDLDASASMLAFGRSPELPGQLLGHPGPPLSNLQTKSLLEELYKLNNKPAIQTTALADPIDISYTKNVTHVYVKVEDPRGLNPRFEGPYRVIDRPSRTQITVRVGSFAVWQPRLLTYNWSSCKPARLREGAKESSRPNVGRRPNPPTAQSKLNVNNSASTGADVANSANVNHETSTDVTPQQSSSPAERGEFESRITTVPEPDFEPPLSRNVHPNYFKKGPVITKAMYDKWTPDMLNIPSSRPVRSTRNPAPKYIDAVGFFGYVAR